VAERVAGNPAVIDPKCDSRAKPAVARPLKKIKVTNFSRGIIAGVFQNQRWAIALSPIMQPIYFCHVRSLNMHTGSGASRDRSAAPTLFMWQKKMVRVGRLGRYPVVGRCACAALVLASLALLSSCNSATVGSSVEGSNLDISDKIRSLDLLPRQTQPVGATAAGYGQNRNGNAALYEGADVTAVSDERLQTTSSGNGFDLNFENTPVATVAKVVLGDILHTGYTIDPRVQGTVSLVSVRPVPKSDIVFVLENALRLSGVVLLHDTSGYRLTPLGDAVGAGRIDGAPSNPEPGYGVSVVPLQYVSAQTLLKLMDSFATRAGSVRADTTRNLLLIQGRRAQDRRRHGVEL
jgi:general secretion pathway protein D